jgi:hypothetical protein
MIHADGHVLNLMRVAIERFERLFPNAQIRCLTGDREFVGKVWY